MSDDPTPQGRDHVGLDLWFTSLAWETEMFARVQRAGFDDISLADSEVLSAIPLSGARLVEVARRRRITKQAAQERIAALIKRGYLTSASDPQDRRARILSHTIRGRALREALNTAKIALHRELEEKLGADRFVALREGLAEAKALYTPGG
ncbi:MAG: MarR family winged helix-turn-helix transcriptional regulator [Rhodobacteraceae bacterium]|nr:MarR family winged helix-turn-helix transcriptional regulator [Paracoccaceae bacterium]